MALIFLHHYKVIFRGFSQVTVKNTLYDSTKKLLISLRISIDVYIGVILMIPTAFSRYLYSLVKDIKKLSLFSAD